MRKKRKNYTGDEKVSILRRHLLDGEAISELCDKYELKPTVFYRWQKEFFDGGAVAFNRERKGEAKRLQGQIKILENELQQRNEVLAEITAEYVRCRKKPLAR